MRTCNKWLAAVGLLRSEMISLKTKPTLHESFVCWFYYFQLLSHNHTLASFNPLSIERRGVGSIQPRHHLPLENHFRYFQNDWKFPHETLHISKIFLEAFWYDEVWNGNYLSMRKQRFLNITYDLLTNLRWRKSFLSIFSTFWHGMKLLGDVIN